MPAIDLHALSRALAEQLAADDAIRDWCIEHADSRRLTPVYGNRSLFDARGGFVLHREVPALVVELGDIGVNTGPGAMLSQIQLPLLAAVVWYEQCPDRAFAARCRLAPLLLNAVHDDVTLGGTCSSALIERMEPSDAASDPAVRTLRFEVAAHVEHRTGA